MRKAVLFALAMPIAGAGLAESRPPDPADAGIKGPLVQYRSVFEDYRPFAEQEVGNWRKANEEVAAVGGHKGHLPGQGRDEKAPPKSPAGQEGPKAKDHGGHK